ncbi:hypothetical protein F4779DRAFT_579513 [Xylariaceae sp. FL0662B]|nr:hypothetical protein F4779DRAFT_579513 [Xylariaceae sp. FL0662B]
MALLDLPPETVASIFGFLAEEDLPSLIVAQSVCRAFKATIEHIFPKNLSRSSTQGDVGEINFHPLLMSKFGTLFDTNSCLPETDELRCLDNDITLPFRCLPWAITEATRAPYLYPEATWRQMSVTWGGPPITRLDLCSSMTVYGGTSMAYYQVELPPAGLTMGLLYDLLLSYRIIFNSSTRDWQLLLGKHLESYGDWQILSSQSTYPSPGAIRRLFADYNGTGQSAVLLVHSSRGCTGNTPKDIGDAWRPKPIGAGKPVLHQWKGCRLPPRNWRDRRNRRNL